MTTCRATNNTDLDSESKHGQRGSTPEWSDGEALGGAQDLQIRFHGANRMEPRKMAL